MAILQEEDAVHVFLFLLEFSFEERTKALAARLISMMCHNGYDVPMNIFVTAVEAHCLLIRHDSLFFDTSSFTDLDYLNARSASSPHCNSIAQLKSQL
jgi:hypothetical protein